MPFLQIFTTVTRAQIPENFGPLLAKALSSVMRNKPVERIAIQVTTDQYMSLGTKDDIPLALVYMRSIGSMDLEDNRQTVKTVTDYINQKLGIEPSNIRMVLQNHSTDTIAMNGKLACDILAQK